MKSYYNRKKNELKLLAKSESIKIDTKGMNSSYYCLKLKEQLTEKIRSKRRKIYSHHLSNRERMSFSEEFEYTYTYERFNGFVNIPNFVESFYKPRKNYLNETYFSNCGMSAIISLLLSCLSSNNLGIDLMYEETYFETIKFINTINKSKSKNKILYIDSIARYFDLNNIENEQL